MSEPDPWAAKPHPIDLNRGIGPFEDGTVARSWMARDLEIFVPSIGAQFQASYRWPSEGNFDRLLAQAESVREGGNEAAAEARVIVGMVTRWNLTYQDSTPLPLTLEVVGTMDSALRTALYRVLLEDYALTRELLTKLMPASWKSGEPFKA